MEIKRTHTWKTGRGARFFSLVIAGFMLFAFTTGCSSEKKEAPKAGAEEQAKADVSTESVARGSAMPDEHPAVDQMRDVITKASHANIKTQKEVDISDEVRAKWTEVQIEITDNAAQASKLVPLKVGSTVQLTDEGHHLKVEVLVPDYAIAGSKITTRSNDPNNPAVLVSLLKGDETVARGWVFRDLPEFNSYNDDRFGLALVAPAPEKGATAK